MPTGEQDMSDRPPPLTREQVLAELDRLATVEHALCVEYLLIGYVLGRGVPFAVPGPSTQPVRDAADAAFGMALSEMGHLRKINGALALVGLAPQVGRAPGIGGDSGSEIAFGTLGLAQPDRFLDRQSAIALAADALHAWLSTAIAPPLFEGDLLDQLQFILDTVGDHASPVTNLRARLAGLAPGDYLRVTRHDPADAIERSLLRLSDQHYALIVATVQASFAHDEQLGGQLRNRALSIMDGLNEIIDLMVQRGLLPAFTLRAAVAEPPAMPASPS